MICIHTETLIQSAEGDDLFASDQPIGAVQSDDVTI